jgi:signal transduction histidine kinase
MKNPSHQTRLRTRILLWSFVPTAVILLAVAVTIYFAYRQIAADLVTGRNQQLTRLSAAELATSLNAYTGTLTSLARTPGLASGDPAQQAAALQQADTTLMVFDGGALVLSPTGKVTVVHPVKPDLLGVDWSRLAFFRQIIHTQASAFSSGAGLFSGVLPGNKESPAAIAVAVPIQGEQGAFQGALVGLFQVRANGYSAFYGNIVKLRLGESGSTYLIDSAGRVIFHPEAGLVGMDQQTRPVVQQALSGRVGSLHTRSLEGRDILASYAPVPGTPWILVSEEDWNALLAASQGYGQFLFLLLALGIVIPTLVVTFGVGRITSPVARLIAGAREIAGGRYGYQIALRTGDELEELVTQFNRMSGELQESYSQLEARVAARTRELAALNAIAAVASRSLDLKEVLGDSLDQTMQALGMRWGAAFCQEKQEGWLDLIAQRDLPEVAVQWIQRRAVQAHALRERSPDGRPFIWPVAEFPESPFRQWMEEAGIQQVIYTSLTVKGSLVGTIAVAGSGPRELSPEEFSLLESIGQQVGIAVENARLYEQAGQSATLAERTRLARELHDSVTQSLYSVTLFAQAAASHLENGDSATAAAHLTDLRETAQEALGEMRLLIYELRPLGLEEKGLAAILQERLDAVETRAGIQCKLRVEGEGEIPLDVQAELFHIAQEALNNVLKHARARNVEVRLRGGETGLTLEIQDDGAGFDAATVKRGGMGMVGMRERVQRMGGVLSIESEPGRGTCVSVQLPNQSSSMQMTPKRKDEPDKADSTADL